jgi:hypothetical protein
MQSLSCGVIRCAFGSSLSDGTNSRPRAAGREPDVPGCLAGFTAHLTQAVLGSITPTSIPHRDAVLGKHCG